jgi:hypothetical protein
MVTSQTRAPKISTHVDGVRAGMLRVRRHRSKDPHIRWYNEKVRGRFQLFLAKFNHSLHSSNFFDLLTLLYQGYYQFLSGGGQIYKREGTADRPTS